MVFLATKADSILTFFLLQLRPKKNIFKYYFPPFHLRKLLDINCNRELEIPIVTKFFSSTQEEKTITRAMPNKQKGNKNKNKKKKDNTFKISNKKVQKEKLKDQAKKPVSKTVRLYYKQFFFFVNICFEMFQLKQREKSELLDNQLVTMKESLRGSIKKNYNAKIKNSKPRKIQVSI